MSLQVKSEFNSYALYEKSEIICIYDTDHEASDFFLGFLCNCFSCFTTVKITFTILFTVHIYDPTTYTLSHTNNYYYISAEHELIESSLTTHRHPHRHYGQTC